MCLCIKTRAVWKPDLLLAVDTAAGLPRDPTPDGGTHQRTLYIHELRDWNTNLKVIFYNLYLIKTFKKKWVPSYFVKLFYDKFQLKNSSIMFPSFLCPAFSLLVKVLVSKNDYQEIIVPPLH